jgi:BED zinc finger
VKVSRKIINSPGLEWFYQHFHVRADKPDKVICLFCSGEFNYVNSSNIIKHIKNAHQGCIEPFTHLAESKIARVKREWDYAVLHSEILSSLASSDKKVSTSTESKSLTQIKIGDSITRTVPIKKQQEFLSEAIVKG